MSSDRPQTLGTSFASTSGFEAGGLREYFVDRDLGVSEATGGVATAIVHRAHGPCPDDVAQRHHHDVRFQMNYVLKGSCRFEFEGHGEMEFGPGDAWTQPPGIKHSLLWFSDDFEVLEVVVPADFATVDE